MATTPLKNQIGFTLIELLAVMAIVAVLAGIIATAVSGTGETSRDTQTQQDATTIESAAAEFFGDQEGAEVLTPKTATVFAVGGINQVTSSRWPENYISEAYPTVFFDVTLSPVGVTVDTLTFLADDRSLSGFTVKGLLEDYNAIDFAALSGGGYLTNVPESTTHRSADLYNSYLWLFEKSTSAGGSSEGAAR